MDLACRFMSKTAMCAFVRKDTQEVFAKQVRRRQHLHDDRVPLKILLRAKMLLDYTKIQFLYFTSIKMKVNFDGFRRKLR